MTIEIPDELAIAMRLPEPELRSRLLQELAVALYAREVLSFGKARQLAGLDHLEFGKLLGRDNVPRQYSDEDLKDDLAYARRERHLPDSESGAH